MHSITPFEGKMWSDKGLSKASKTKNPAQPLSKEGHTAPLISASVAGSLRFPFRDPPCPITGLVHVVFGDGRHAVEAR